MGLLLNRIDDDFVGTKSKTITLNGLLWHSEFLKWFDGKRNYFEVEFHCDNEKTSDDCSCELSATLKLMPLNSDSVLIEKRILPNCDLNENHFTLTLIEWSIFQRQFVKRKTIEIMM